MLSLFVKQRQVIDGSGSIDESMVTGESVPEKKAPGDQFIAGTINQAGSIRWSIIASLVVGLSIFAWRLSGNIPELNADPVGALSPNDWLCLAITHVFLGV